MGPILLSSHHLGEVDRACDRIVFMNAGQLIADETPGSVHERAERVLRLGYADRAQAEALKAALASHAERITLEGSRASVMLREPDPRSFLSALAGADQLAPPKVIEHGQISLQELYRDLYGVEGV